MSAVERTRAAAQKILEEAAVMEEHGELTNDQMLARSMALLQHQVCSLFEAVQLMQEQIDAIKWDVDCYVKRGQK